MLKYVCVPSWGIVFTMAPNRLIVIEGGIACGKSSALTWLEELEGEDDRVLVLHEPQREWKKVEVSMRGEVRKREVNFLREFYDTMSCVSSTDEERGAALMRLQLVITDSLLRRKKKAEEAWDYNSSTVVVMERSAKSGLFFLMANRHLLDPRDYTAMHNLLGTLSYLEESGLSVRTERICLTASKEVMLERASKSAPAIDEQYLVRVKEMFDYLGDIDDRYLPTIDTTDKTPEEVAEKIQERIFGRD